MPTPLSYYRIKAIMTRLSSSERIFPWLVSINEQCGVNTNGETWNVINVTELSFSRESFKEQYVFVGMACECENRWDSTMEIVSNECEPKRAEGREEKKEYAKVCVIKWHIRIVHRTWFIAYRQNTRPSNTVRIGFKHFSFHSES